MFYMHKIDEKQALAITINAPVELERIRKYDLKYQIDPFLDMSYLQGVGWIIFSQYEHIVKNFLNIR